MISQNRCGVIIPIYRSTLTDDEAISLGTIRKHLGAMGLCFMAPESLNLDEVVREGDGVERFPDECFESIDGYNQLLKSSRFYRRFHAFTHILICQLDCLIFRGDLDFWMSKGYDYMASPWFKRFAKEPGRGLWRVGNGGLSLRRVEAHLRVLQQKVASGSIYPRFGNSYWKEAYPSRKRGLYKKITSMYRMIRCNRWSTVEEELKQHRYNEDVFWAIEAPKFNPEFNLPSPEQALPFAFEVAPRWCFEKNQNRLPFGCHAWARYDRKFWDEVLTSLNSPMMG